MMAKSGSAKPAVAFTLRPADDYQRTHYRLLFESVETVDVTGRAGYARHHKHRVNVWADEQCTGGHGTHILSAESVVIALHPEPQSPHLGTVREGDVVRLVYPDGSVADYTVVPQSLRDPKLVELPVVAEVRAMQADVCGFSHEDGPCELCRDSIVLHVVEQGWTWEALLADMRRFRDDYPAWYAEKVVEYRARQAVSAG